MNVYHATAKLPDGTEIETTGALVEVMQWADKVAQDAGGTVKINIGLQEDV